MVAHVAEYALLLLKHNEVFFKSNVSTQGLCLFSMCPSLSSLPSSCGFSRRGFPLYMCNVSSSPYKSITECGKSLTKNLQA